MIQKVGIVGRGAIGALYGTLLMEHGCKDLVFIVDEDRKKRYETDPVTINGKDIPFSYVTKGDPLDLILICTKYAGLNAAIEEIKDFMSPHTILLSCLNGIESETILRRHFSKDQVIRCIVQGMDSTYLNNTVDFSHVGQILFGAENEHQKALVDALEVFFEQYAIPYRRCENIYRDQWNKLMLNCGINQVCAAHQTGYGGCQNGGAYQKEFIMAMKEVQKVARAKGIDLKDQDIEVWIDLVNSLRPEGMPSMAQDVQAKRKTELALFSGTLVPQAKKEGIEVPVLEKLMKEIQRIEQSFA